MAQTLVINRTQFAPMVDIILANGEKTAVQIGPRSRGHLPEGATVCPRWKARNGDKVTVIEPQAPEQGPALVQVPQDEAPVKGATATDKE
ncbi:hypothetical protein [Burkholderia phage BCSR5]|nr:hypothetical protein [Burkholderia phage BCSR5]